MMKSKDSKKLIFGSYLVILLILLIGLFSLYSMIKFNENIQTKAEINEFTNELDHTILDFLLLINTDNLDDYNEIKADIEFKRTRIDPLHKKIDSTLERLNQGDNFDDNLNEFTQISNALIRIQKSIIIDNDEFDVKKEIEKSLRYGLRSNVSDNFQFVSDNWRIGYHSKETLYQYKDEKHLNEWLESIEEFKDHVKKSNLQQEIKDELLEKSDLYNVVALDVGDLVLRQADTEEDKQLKIQKLEEIVHSIEEDGREISREISREIRYESDSIARNTFFIIIVITVIGIVLLFVFQRYFIGKIKRK